MTLFVMLAILIAVPQVTTADRPATDPPAAEAPAVQTSAVQTSADAQTAKATTDKPAADGAVAQSADPAADAERHQAAETAFRTIGGDMMTFFRDPSEERFLRIVTVMEEHGDVLKEFPRLAPPIMFLAVASEKYGYELGGQSDTLRTAVAVRDKDLSVRWAKVIHSDHMLNGTRLDLWWSSFFATGDRKYLKRIVREMKDLEKPEVKEGEKPDLERTMAYAVSESAKWSFRSLARQLPEVAGFALDAARDPEFEDQKVYLLVSLAGARLPPEKVREMRKESKQRAAKRDEAERRDQPRRDE